ncbi:universal stress protein [Streptomyces sp. NPDC046939]|uniref:universal stress protein n=1 Tax=Streptomyces sp. NPDC046939 TaxID=3155376 RepID=UPI0033D2F776
MTRSVIAGLDGTPESRAAAAWAAREALLRDRPLLLMHAWKWQPYTYAPLAGISVPPNGGDPEQKGAQALLDEVEAGIRRRHPELAVSTAEIAEEPVPALMAAGEQAELLVLGSRGLSGFTGFVVGSVAHGVVARSTVPVVLVRAEESAQAEHQPDATGRGSVDTPYRDVVLGLDLWHAEASVLQFAFEAAARRRAALRVVHGWTLPPYYYGYDGALDRTLNAQRVTSIREELTALLHPWRGKFPEVLVREQSRVEGAAHLLLDASLDASLVVVGRRNRRVPLGGHVGPVTQAVLHHCAAPVAVVPHA